MKKVLKWMGIAVLTPVLLFIILAALLYLPPVQNWVVQKVTAIASEKTGMEISIGHVNLEWPLDLGIDDLRRPRYEVLEIGVYSTELVDCIVVQLILPGREQYRRVIFVWG